MKKLNKLFAILFAVLGVTTLKAQNWTDKTSLLVDPSFESQTTSTDLGQNKSGWGVPTGGWTLSPSTAPSNSQSGVIASSCPIQGIATTFPTSDGGNYFYVRTNWNNDVTFALSQTVSNAPAGLYRLTCKAASNAGNWSTAKFNLSLKEGDSNVSTNSSLNKCSEWTEWSVDLYKKDASTDLTIEATMYPGSSGNGQHYQLLLDDFELQYISLDDIEAEGWLKPLVPGSNLKSFVGTSVVAALYNVGSDAFVTRGMTWATQAIATKLHNSDTQAQSASDRHHVKLSAGDNGKVRFSVNGKNYLGDGGQGSTTTVYTDNGKETNQFEYSIVDEGNVYSLKVATATSDVDAYLDVAQPYGGQLTYANGQGFTEWAVIKFSDIENGKYAQYKAKKAMYEVYQAVVAAGHTETYSSALRTALETYIRTDVSAADVTAATKTLVEAVSPALTKGYVNANALFTNPDMRGAGTKEDWTSGYTNIGWGVFENYHTNHGDRKLTQTKTVPNGFYKVVFHGIWRQDGSDAAPTLTLTSGSNSISANVPCMTDIAFGVGNAFTEGNNVNNWKDVNGKIIPNGMQSAGEGLSHRDAQVTISDFVVSNGQLTIEMNSSSTSQWILAQGFDIYFKAESLEEYANLFNEAKAAADAIDASTLNTYAKNTLTTALNNAATEQIDKEWYQARTAELNDAVAIAKDVAAPYAKVSALLATCEDILNNSEEFVADAKTTFTTIVNAAKTNTDNAQTSAVINEEYGKLEAARQEYVQKADPINEISFDYTFLLKNPSFETGTTEGWTTSSGGDTGAKLNSNGTYTINGADGEFIFNTWGASNMRVEQTLTNIPTGLYTVKAIVASDANSVIKLTAGDTYEDVTITTDKSTATEGIVETSYSSGDFLIKAASENWFKADHFRLYFRGFDVPTAQLGVTNLKAEAEELLNQPMNAAVAADLNAAIEGADAAADTRNELTPMIDALNAAIDAAEVSIAEYEKIAQYIAKANTIDASIAASYKSNYENRTLSESAEAVFQALEVATYNYVTNEFSYPVELEASGWIPEGPVGELSDQHWSGEKRPYMEQSSAAWGWDAWSISYDQDLTLPAGEYVFKVAGRKAAGDGCALSLIVTKEGTTLGTVNDFPEGDTGRGIETNGTANFSEEGTYVDVIEKGQIVQANGGRGWQWRYVKFTLDSEATVNIAVKAEATTYHQWISFCDATVQMTEETYLAANMHGLDAPTAAANALVDTKPMGTAENNALKAALDMPVTTGAELQAKITALEAAVANANAWVPKYNEEKAPLVAALERFEADYNDAQNGALNHMNKDCWATAISMAQAAAEAKDVTNSYEGFATAANNLIAALDAATTSIDEYAALNEAIGQAEVLAGANVGDQPFQRSQEAINGLGIADAQATYTAATADSEKVTSVTETLKAAINGIVLNAPAEGQRFNMVMSYAGWEHDGKAVTYLAGGRNDAGLYNIQYYAAPNANYAQAFTFTAVEGQPDCYTLSMTDVDGNERYVCAGTIYGGNTSQLRTTTDASQALAVKVIATATEGVWNLYNTAANNYIGGTDAGFYTVNSHTTFRLQEAQKAEVTLTISDAKWSTLMLPFNAELPGNVKAYSCSDIMEDGVTLTLVEAESLKANTPYLVNGKAGKHEFAGYGLADKNSYTVGLFTGTYVDYQTEVGTNTYVLQKNNNVVAFYLVGDNNLDKQPKVGANHCYLTVPAEVAGAPMFSISRGEDTTGIENATLNAQPSTVIYDLMGRKVTTMVKGGMYIVNGKKVVIK